MRIHDISLGGRCEIKKVRVEFYSNAAYECSSILDIRKSRELPRLAIAKCYRELGNEEQALDYEREASDVLNEE